MDLASKNAPRLGAPQGPMGHGWRRIVKKAYQLTRQPGFLPGEWDDLVQELSLRVWRKLRRYDRARGRHSTFIDRIVQSEATSLVRERTAAKRDFLRDGPSINSLLNGGKNGVATLADMLTEDAHELRHGHAPDHELLAKSAERLLGECEDDESQVLRAIMHQPVAEAARSLGVSRQRIYRVIQRVRKRYEGTSLQGFLDAQPDTSA